MKVIPAIDLMGGRVVRLVKGDVKHVLDYSYLGDPTKIAGIWVSQGADTLHIIDLDGAKGTGDNIDILISIIKSIDVNIQFGGGIRSLEKARKILNKGVHRIILGSLAIRSPYVVKQIINEFGDERVIVALDYDTEGIVLYKGWSEKTYIKVENLILRFRELGCIYFLLTSASKDGTLEGPDLETLYRTTKFGKIIAAGGIRTINDLLNLKKLGVYGVVIGRALYEGRINFKEALEKVGVNAFS